MTHMEAGDLPQWADDVPPMAPGTVGARLGRLGDLAATQDLSVARLAEAHLDAHAILEEAGSCAGAGLYGVWASESGGEGVTAQLLDGRFRITGTKAFCSGAAGGVARALVTAWDAGSRLLLDVPIDPANGCSVRPDSWQSQAFAASGTRAVHFDGAVADAVVGTPGWYVGRPGFELGAVAVAACWAGGARPLVERMGQRITSTDHHGLAHLGICHARSLVSQTMLVRAADLIDRGLICGTELQQLALVTRNVIAEDTQEILARAGRSLGPALFVRDAATSQRVTDLTLYIRQHHAERDHERLGAIVRAAS